MIPKIESNKETYLDGVKLCLQIIEAMIADDNLFGQDTNQLEKVRRNIINNM